MLLKGEKTVITVSEKAGVNTCRKTRSTNKKLFTPTIILPLRDGESSLIRMDSFMR